MKSGRMLKEVNPIGGYEKANAVNTILGRLRCSLENVLYVGDSITDVSPYQLVRKGEGLTISFNGNEYAIREAELAVISENTVPVSILADCFNRFGKYHTVKLAGEWSRPALEKYIENSKLLPEIFGTYAENHSRVEVIKSNNRERLVKESTLFRKTVRGEAIGRLG